MSLKEKMLRNKEDYNSWCRGQGWLQSSRMSWTCSLHHQGRWQQVPPKCPKPFTIKHDKSLKVTFS